MNWLVTSKTDSTPIQLIVKKPAYLKDEALYGNREDQVLALSPCCVVSEYRNDSNLAT